jgi:hypothetical protein
MDDTALELDCAKVGVIVQQRFSSKAKWPIGDPAKAPT